MRQSNSSLPRSPVRPLALLVGGIFIAAPLSYSQEPPVPSKEKESGPSVRVMLLVPGGPNLELISIAGEKMSEPFNVGARGLSSEFFPKSLVFNLAIRDSKAEKGVRSVASVTLPETSKHFIVLLEPKDASAFKVHVVDSKQPSFGADSLLFFNAADTPVAAAMDEKKILLKPREITIVPAPPSKGDLPYFHVALYRPEGSGTRAFASSRWPHRKDARVYVFIYRIPETDRYTFQSVSESLAKPVIP